MPTRVATPCLTPRCPAVAGRSGLCAGHARSYERRRGTAAQRGYGWSWQVRRRRILARDPICRHESGCTEPSVEVDHIIPKALGGDDDPSNLRGTCVYHNRSRRPERV